MLHAEEVSVTAGRARLVEGLSVALRPGRMLAILGPNGAGKSTLLSLLSGERRPTLGRVRLDGRDLHALPPGRLARRRALVTQHPAAGFAFSVDEAMALATEIVPASAAERRRLIDESLRAADAEGLRDRLLPQLSGGERQRVAFARALAQLAAGRRTVEVGGAPYLLLDEPTASLDPAHQHHLLGAARSWVERVGGGCAVVLHDLSLAARYCDDGLLLAGGREAWSGAMADLPVPVLERVFGTRFVRLPLPDAGGWIFAATGQGVGG
ncbi:ATP-binding cassette domain-containing protein [Azospirillum agricola]|uniref:ATP-binding cassette domain-containing protein n=1 Tax=Azospirillum agricola TaxID=1720247 RepID=UPI000A0F208D|nr:ATP-binding cassette domain-containing protein [Azospirillum agricola]SMH40012.1 iron complex transport system ATP-binding protein [Azospirillum lipoferum]